MDTLLNKVARIEAAAAQAAASIETREREELTTLLEREPAVLDDTRTRATAKAEAIIKEKVEQSKRQLNTLRQDEEQSVKMVAAAAAKNRAATIALAVSLLTREYETSA